MSSWIPSWFASADPVSGPDTGPNGDPSSSYFSRIREHHLFPYILLFCMVHLVGTASFIFMMLRNHNVNVARNLGIKRGLTAREAKDRVGVVAKLVGKVS
jgi:hypothetical protein